MRPCVAQIAPFALYKANFSLPHKMFVPQLISKPQDELPASDQTAQVLCAEATAEYALDLHLLALFVLLAVSLLGAAFPFVIRRYSKSAVNLTILKLFGAGILLATALVHMLGAAYELFSNPCLGEPFISYSAWPGALCCLGLLLAHCIQSATQHQACSKEKQACVQVYMLEGSVVLHSILIGITLGIEPNVVPLMIAISVHQLFEGIAVSSLVVDHFYNLKWTSLFLSTCYVLSTPLGVVIGILTASTLDQQTPGTVVLLGVLEALAAGILIYDSIANLMIPSFTDTNKQHATCLLALWAGAAVMAVIGYWA